MKLSKILEKYETDEILDEIDIDEIIEYLEDGDYKVFREDEAPEYLEDMDEDDIIGYLEDKGYIVTPAEEEDPSNKRVFFDRYISDGTDMRETLYTILGLGHYVDDAGIIQALTEFLSLNRK